MSAVLPIEPDPRFRRYTASAGQKLFSIKFPFQQNEDIAIFLYADGIYTEISPTLYSIVGAGEPEGSVTFNTGRNEGDVIATVGRAILDRMSSVVRDGRFSSRLIDDELDRNRIIQQEQQRDIDRSLKFDFGVSFGIIETPEDGRVLMWRQNGPFWHIVNGPSAQEIADAEANAEAARQAAEEAKAAAASINLPSMDPGDAGNILTVKGDGSGYEFRTAIISVPTRTILKALPVIFPSVYLYEAGREGTFILKTGSAPIVDAQEGIYVISNEAGYFWERVYAPAIAPTVRAFGAKLDGTANDSLAIQGSLNVCGIAYVPYTATGFVAGDINLGTNRKLVGELKPVWKTPASASCGVRVTCYMAESPSVLNEYSYIQNFVFDLSASPVSTTAIRMGTATRVVYGLRVFNVDGRNCGEFYGEETHATNFVVDMQFTDCICYLTRGRQIYSKRSRGFFTFRDIKIDHGYNTAQVTWEGARFEDLIGLELEKFDVVGPITASLPTVEYQPNAIGIVIAGSGDGGASVWLTRVLIDTTRGPALQISNIFNIQATNTCLYGNLGQALTLVNVTKSLFTNTKLRGTKGETGAAAGAHGVSLTGCSDVVFNGIESEHHTGTGIILVNSTDCKFMGGYSKDNTGFGLFESGSCNRNINVGLQLSGNTAGTLTQVGSASASVFYHNNAGVLTANTIGVAAI
ncbi:hypothetical protein [Brucella anthropi]|uniref:right-handed parallel beta-helix repeat-containing protein n=1 Tax=Brucella anthropi TaxID=529 RepID=UPI003D953F22